MGAESQVQGQEVQQETGAEAAAEKMYTQAEMDAAIEKRLARERRKYPSADELERYRSWQASSQAEGSELAAITAERDQLRADADSAKQALETMRRERYLMGKGLSEEQAEFAAWKLSGSLKDGEDFAKAADAYVEAHVPGKPGVAVSFGSLSGESPPKTGNDAINAAIRSAGKR